MQKIDPIQRIRRGLFRLWIVASVFWLVSSSIIFAFPIRSEISKAFSPTWSTNITIEDIRVDEITSQNRQGQSFQVSRIDGGPGIFQVDQETSRAGKSFEVAIKNNKDLIETVLDMFEKAAIDHNDKKSKAVRDIIMSVFVILSFPALSLLFGLASIWVVAGFLGK